jgi:hypothetical protein
MLIRHAIWASTCALMLSTTPSGARQAPAAAFAGPITSLVSPAAPGSAEPNLTTDASGRVWLSWLEPRTGGGHRFRASTLSGATWSAPITIVEDNNLLANWADFPSLFIAADGTMAAHWLERATGREAYFVRIRLSKDGGRTWSPTLTPHKDASATEHGFVSFYDAPGGGVGLAWLDGREMAGGGHAMAGHSASMTLRSTVIRNGVAGDEAVIDARVCDCCQTSAARSGNTVLVAYRDRSDKDIRDTSVARFENGAWSEPVTVHADGWEITGCPVNGPVVTATGKAAAVAWFTGAGGAPKTFVAFSADGARTFGAPIRLDRAVTLGRLGMIMPAADRVVVSSVERTQTGGRLILREVRQDGRVSEPIQVSEATPDRTGGFARLAQSGRRLIVAWTDVKPGTPSRVLVSSLQQTLPGSRLELR